MSKLRNKYHRRPILIGAGESYFVYKPSKPLFQPDLSKLSESQRKMVLAARADRPMPETIHVSPKPKPKRKPRVKVIPPESPDYSSRYLAYIASPSWRRKRAQLFKARGRQCETCGATRGIIQAHHLTYARLGHELLTDLQVICKPCHEHHHGKRFALRNERLTQSGDLESKWMHLTKIQAIR